MKKHFILALVVLLAAIVVWADVTPTGDGNTNTAELTGTISSPPAGQGNTASHSWDSGVDADSDGQPDTGVFAAGLNGANASATNPYGAKTVVYNGQRIYADGSWCHYWTHVQDLSTNPWMGLITVVELCCEDMTTEYSSGNCYWNVYYKIVSTWPGTSGQISATQLDSIVADPNAHHSGGTY